MALDVSVEFTGPGVEVGVTETAGEADATVPTAALGEEFELLPATQPARLNTATEISDLLSIDINFRYELLAAFRIYHFAGTMRIIRSSSVAGEPRPSRFDVEK